MTGRFSKLVLAAALAVAILFSPLVSLANVTMYAPGSIGNATTVNVADGTTYTVANGTISALEKHVQDLIRLGFSFSGQTIAQSSTNSITAFAGGGQTNATALTAQINRVTTVATAGDSVKLPPATVGLWVVVINKGANPMQVFGAGTDTINGVATATGISQMQNSVDLYVCAVAGSWEVEGTAIGFNGSLETNSALNSITAFAGGGQGSAAALTAMINRVTTVATIGDSVKLPASAVGMTIVVSNAGANPMDVFPATGDAINALAANTALRINNGTTVSFWCSVAGTWHSLVQSLPAAKYVKNTTAGATTAAAGDLTGAAYVSVEYSAVGAANLTTRTATQMFADMGNVQPGDSYTLEITNTSGFTTTLVAGSGVTLTGTMTLATNTTRRFNVKFNSATTLTIQSVGVGTISWLLWDDAPLQLAA